MEADALPPRGSDYARRLPASLDDLRGPAAGTVELPLHVARREWEQGLMASARW